MMELKVNEYQLPSEILFNFDELKNEIAEKVSVYSTIIYTDETVKDAKADLAKLRKLKKALNDERIRRQDEYMQPFEAFKAKINEIIRVIDEPISVIDKQVKEFEDAKKAAKRKEILAYMSLVDVPYGIDLVKIFDLRWLNATYAMSSIKAAIDERAAIIRNNVKHLETLGESSEAALLDYFNNLNLSHAMEAARQADAHRENIRKAEESRKAQEVLRKAAENPVIENAPAPPKAEEPAAEWVNFSAFLSREKALKLRDFFAANNIRFKKI